jgi:TPR repeat protein
MHSTLKILSLFLAFFFSAPLLAQLSTEQIQEKSEGIVLFNQYRIAAPLLTPAAEAGDPEAQYFLAEEIRSLKQYLSPEAVKWFEASAQQGNVYAMIQLGRSGADLCTQMKNCQSGDTSPSEWIAKAKETTAPKAASGNSEALYLMYELTGDRDWLKKSAEAGFALSQYWMGIQERQGEGFFLLPGQRESSVEHWMKAAAESGYPKAMMAYGAILARKGDIEGYKTWSVKAAEAGFADAVLGYACDSAHEPDEYGYPLDLVKAYGLMSLLAELDGGGGMQINVKDIFPKIIAKMSPEQINLGKKFAVAWRANHPPLSFFPDKLDN